MMSKFREMKASKKGFTLMEILVAVVIIGIFGAVAASAVPGMIGKAHQRALVNQLATVQQAVDRYIAEEGVYPVAGTVNGVAMNATATLDVKQIEGAKLIDGGYLLNINTKGGNFGFSNPAALFGITEGGAVFALDETAFPATPGSEKVFTAYDATGGLTFANLK